MVACKKSLCCKLTCGIVGIISLVTGCVLIKVFDRVIHNQVDESLPLKNGSESYNNWVSPPAPIYFQIYVLNVINPVEVIQKGARPVLEQKGPYTYREKRHKVNITYVDDDESLVSYQEDQWFYFDLEKSVGPETDNFTTVNLPMLTVANMVRFEYGWLRKFVNWALNKTNEQLFINLTVRELMWGYEDNLLKFLKDEAAKFGFKLPIDDRFGLFMNKNGSNDGVYTVKTGMQGTIDQFAEIVSWNNETSLTFWNSSIANSLNGSDGTLYPPFVDKSKSLYLFSSDLCRSLEIEYTNGYGLKGIDVDRFAVPPVAFANVSVNPDNMGFCTPSTNCLPAGLLNASVCRDGAPVILSLPHFLYGDPAILDRVVGMHPNVEEHQSVIDIEPMTGVVMNAAKRLQINAYLTNISDIKQTLNFHEYVVLPILWLNESATIDGKSASDFKNKVLLAVKVTEAVQYGLIGLGGFLLICVLIMILRAGVCRPKGKELQVVSEKTPILSSA